MHDYTSYTIPTEINNSILLPVVEFFSIDWVYASYNGYVWAGGIFSNGGNHSL